jgi:outer membrane protein assembly factor BamD
MKKLTTIYIIVSSVALISCNSYNQVFKSTDYEYKYEAAKEYFATGQFLRSAQLLEQTVVMFKGSDKAQESLFMLAMCYYNINDFETASLYLERYFKTYPKGEYTELARFYAGKASYLQSPDPRLDQTPTHTAINPNTIGYNKCVSIFPFNLILLFITYSLHHFSGFPVKRYKTALYRIPQNVKELKGKFN